MFPEGKIVWIVDMERNVTIKSLTEVVSNKEILFMNIIVKINKNETGWNVIS